MKHSDFKINESFVCGDNIWLVTDIGTRTIIAIKISELPIHNNTDGITEKVLLSKQQAIAAGWFIGPPYAVKVEVFDEYDIAGCHEI